MSVEALNLNRYGRDSELREVSSLPEVMGTERFLQTVENIARLGKYPKLDSLPPTITLDLGRYPIREVTSEFREHWEGFRKCPDIKQAVEILKKGYLFFLDLHERWKATEFGRQVYCGKAPNTWEVGPIIMGEIPIWLNGKLVMTKLSLEETKQRASAMRCHAHYRNDTFSYGFDLSNIFKSAFRAEKKQLKGETFSWGFAACEILHTLGQTHLLLPTRNTHKIFREVDVSSFLSMMGEDLIAVSEDYFLWLLENKVIPYIEKVQKLTTDQIGRLPTLTGGQFESMVNSHWISEIVQKYALALYVDRENQGAFKRYTETPGEIIARFVHDPEGFEVFP